MESGGVKNLLYKTETRETKREEGGRGRAETTVWKREIERGRGRRKRIGQEIQ